MVTEDSLLFSLDLEVFDGCDSSKLPYCSCIVQDSHSWSLRTPARNASPSSSFNTYAIEQNGIKNTKQTMFKCMFFTCIICCARKSSIGKVTVGLKSFSLNVTSLASKNMRLRYRLLSLLNAEQVFASNLFKTKAADIENLTMIRIIICTNSSS